MSNILKHMSFKRRNCME